MKKIAYIALMFIASTTALANPRAGFHDEDIPFLIKDASKKEITYEECQSLRKSTLYWQYSSQPIRGDSYYIPREFFSNIYSVHEVNSDIFILSCGGIFSTSYIEFVKEEELIERAKKISNDRYNREMQERDQKAQDLMNLVNKTKNK